MSRTTRTTYDGRTVRDGQWARHCVSTNCPWCVDGTQKRPHRRKRRKQAKRVLRSLETLRTAGYDA